MEEVFDLRAFVIMLLKKFKLIIILAVIFGILGGGYGFFFGGADLYSSTSSASVNTTDTKATDATALTSIMTNVKEIVTGDYFYSSILYELKNKVGDDGFSRLFGGQATPSISTLKDIIKITVNGNLVLVEVTTSNEKLSIHASEVCRRYIMDELTHSINNVQLKVQNMQTVNKSELEGNTNKTRGIKFGILGFGGGIVLAVLWIFFFDVFDLKIRSAADLKKYKIPVLGEATKD